MFRDNPAYYFEDRKLIEEYVVKSIGFWKFKIFISQETEEHFIDEVVKNNAKKLTKTYSDMYNSKPS